MNPIYFTLEKSVRDGLIAWSACGVALTEADARAVFGADAYKHAGAEGVYLFSWSVLDGFKVSTNKGFLPFREVGSFDCHVERKLGRELCALVCTHLTKDLLLGLGL